MSKEKELKTVPERNVQGSDSHTPIPDDALANVSGGMVNGLEGNSPLIPNRKFDSEYETLTKVPNQLSEHNNCG